MIYENNGTFSIEHQTNIAEQIGIETYTGNYIFDSYNTDNITIISITNTQGE